MKLLAMLALVACETAEPTPTPTVPEPPPPPPLDAGPEPVDAPPPAVVADANCYVNGPKEIIQIETDEKTNRGLLYRMTTGPVPDRYVRFTVRPDGPSALELVFDRYEKHDYQRIWNARPTAPRERLQRGKSVIARVFVKDGKSYIAGEAIDLHTGMRIQHPGNAYPCALPGRPRGGSIYLPP